MLPLSNKNLGDVSKESKSNIYIRIFPLLERTIYVMWIWC